MSEVNWAFEDFADAVKPYGYIRGLVERLQEEVGHMREVAKREEDESPSEAERLRACARELEAFAKIWKADVRRRRELWECVQNVTAALSFLVDRLRTVP